MWDFMESTNEIQEALGRSYNTPDYLDEEDLLGGTALVSIQHFRLNCIAVTPRTVNAFQCDHQALCDIGLPAGVPAELDALEADLGAESEEATPSYLLPDTAAPSDLSAELADLHLPSAPTGTAAELQANPRAQPVSEALISFLSTTPLCA